MKTIYKEHMRHVKNKELNKSAVAAHFWSHKHSFEKKPILLKHINNRPLPELLIWEKIFIYKYKEVSIILKRRSSVTSTSWWMPMVAGRRSWWPASLIAAEDEGKTLRKCSCLSVSKSETKNVLIHIQSDSEQACKN